jgi:hypothetical protein
VRPRLTPGELALARDRFEQDQAHAEYVEYTVAMERIANARRWRRTRQKFLGRHGYLLSGEGIGPLRAPR